MLNWKTYNALPRLKSYQEALAHWEKTIPIRGDANGTKPVGRRDQKWLNIYMREDKAICIGSMWRKENPLLAYYPDGRVGIEQHISASCRERIQRIAGLNIQRRDNEDWVQASVYVDSEAVTGKYPLQLRYYNSPRKAFFILHGDSAPTYLNPVPVYKHLINRQVNAEITARYKPFLAYVEVMSKLSADQPVDNPQVPTTTFDERKAIGLPVANLNWRYGNSDEALGYLVTMLDSGDTGEWYKAMVWMSANYWRMYLSDFRNALRDTLYRKYRDVLFTKVRADAGTFVHDRYGRFFR